MTQQEIILSMQRAFLGAICNKISLITFDATQEVFSLFVYVDASLSEEENEAINVAVTEVLADFPNFLYENIQIIPTNTPYPLLKTHKNCFFRRFEVDF